MDERPEAWPDTHAVLAETRRAIEECRPLKGARPFWRALTPHLRAGLASGVAARLSAHVGVRFNTCMVDDSVASDRRLSLQTRLRQC
jgi:hypothetical protein